MKTICLLLIIISMIVMTSCKKETATTSTNNKTPDVIFTGSTTIDQLVSRGTQFGAGGFLGLTTDQKIAVYNKLGVHTIRALVTLKDFTGGVSALNKLTGQGFKVILNLNWSPVPKKGDDRIATAWPKEMNLCRQKLGEVFKKYKPDVAVIENEPTVDIFHSGPIEDYITELTNAIQVCKQYGVVVADGGIHVPLILEVMRSGNLNNENAVEVKKLIAAYKKLNLDYINVHYYGGSSYTSGSFEKAADYLIPNRYQDLQNNFVALCSKNCYVTT